MKKTIGIYADTFNGKVGNTFAYMQFFSQFGYVRLISTTDNLENVVNEVDMLVLPGGADVDTSTYGGVPGVNDSRVNGHYEYLDLQLLPKFIEAKKPIFGICRGFQRLNTWFGGTLNQHVIGHHQGDNRERRPQEIQFVEEDAVWYVNTMHHQSINELGKGLQILAYSERDHDCYSNKNHRFPWRIFDKGGNIINRDETSVIVEAFKHEELPIYGVQFHPEEFNCRYSRILINQLLGINNEEKN